MSEAKTPEPAPITPADPIVRKWSDWIKPWQTVIGVVLGIATGVGGTWLNIQFVARSAARDAVTDEKFLGDLSAIVRPTCVFDSKGVVSIERGTENYVGAIKVTARPERLGLEVLLEGKRHLAYTPILTCLNAGLQIEESERTAGYGWRFLMTPLNSVMGSPAGTIYDTNHYQFDHHWNYRFRLEILH